MNVRIEHRICWRVIGLLVFAVSFSLFTPAFPCFAYVAEEGMDGGIVGCDSTEGSGAFAGGGCPQGPAIMLAKHRKIRTNRLSKAKSRRGQKSYLDGNGMVCPGITILTAVV